MNAIVYLRCSDPRQDRSVADQRQAIEARAAQDGVRILPGGWFVDDGISGLTVDDRPGLLAMRAWAQAHRGEAQVLNAWAQSRLGRNPSETVATLALLDAAKIDTRFLTDPEPADVETRDLLRFIRAQIDAQHSRRLSKDVPRGMRAAAREGRCPWPAPFGWRAHHDLPGRAGRLLPVPEQAEVVREVFALYEAGDGDKAIAATLTARGVPPPEHRTKRRQRAPGTWRPKHVRSILTNPTHAGRIVYQGEVLCEQAHEPLIAPDRFDRLQALRRSKYRERRRENPVRASERGVFRPWLRCGHCGGGMTIQHGRPNKLYYCCRVRAENRSACPGTNTRVDLLDALLLDTIAAELLTDAALDAAAARWRASLDGEGRAALARQRAVIEARLREAAAGIQRLVALVARGTVEEADIADELRRLRAARDAARDDLALLPVPQPLPSATPDDLAALRRRVLAAHTARPLAERRTALAAILTSITLRPGSAVVRYRPRLTGGGDPHHDPNPA